MMATLVSWIGTAGLVAGGLWLAALAVRIAVEPARQRALLLHALVLVLATGGVAAGIVALRQANRIEIDRTEELKAQLEEKKAIKEEARKVLKQRAAKVRFAEDSDTDQLDVAGIKNVDNPVIAAATMDVKEEVKQSAARVLPEPERNAVLRANRLNLAAAVAVFLFGALSLVTRYLSGANRDPLHPFPLPLSSPLLDAVFPQSEPLVRVDGKDLDAVLAHLARRGENFIVLGPVELPATGVLPRLVLGPVRLGTLPVQRVDSGFRGTFLFLQNAWEGKNAVIVPDGGNDGRWLDELAAFIETRTRLQARARRTVNIVWAGAPDVLARREAELALLCREANFRLLVASPRKDA